ncbi:hypothetical protein ACFQMG_06710 [Kitasatospora paranensis]|uniref:Low molecular weight antigen MTB12-like C-terminal domain-containing protein n=1 Tax=Kitasatospora paranensis TaxID=258053 RepID=A0ABW2FPZ1_9ACTN
MQTTQSESTQAADRHPDGRPPVRYRARAGTAARIGAVLAALVLAAACSSSSSSSSSSPSASAPASSAAPASPSGSAPADPAAAKAEITTNWQKFFDPATSIQDKAALLQNGQALSPALQGFAADPRVGQVKAEVKGVEFTSPTTATVTYTLSLQGNVVEPSATGQAVLDGGTWKVSTSTLCGLVAQAGSSAVPGCR